MVTFRIWISKPMCNMVKDYSDVDFKTAGIIAITFLVGSYFGSKIAITIDTKLVKQIFAVSIILIGIKMLWNR